MDIKADKAKEDFAKRINQAMDAKGYPVRGRARILSKEFNISDKGAGKWLKGEAIPETSKLPTLAEFLGVGTEWLLSGVESKSQENLIPFDNSISPKPNDIHISPIQFKSSFESKNTVKIPVHKNVKASCGAGVENFLEEITDYVEVDPLFLQMLGVKAKPEKLRLIYSDEWSMWPTVVPDTPLFVDITPVDTSAMISGNVYVFLHNSILRMKRVFVSYGDERTVRLQSDNPDKNKYPDEIITREQLNELSFVGRLELALVKP